MDLEKAPATLRDKLTGATTEALAEYARLQEFVRPWQQLEALMSPKSGSIDNTYDDDGKTVGSFPLNPTEFDGGDVFEFMLEVMQVSDGAPKYLSIILPYNNIDVDEISMGPEEPDPVVQIPLGIMYSPFSGDYELSEIIEPNPETFQINEYYRNAAEEQEAATKRREARTFITGLIAEAFDYSEAENQRLHS